MKKILIILTILFVTANSFSQVNNCCPNFVLKQMGDIMPCPGDSTCFKDPHQGGGNPGGAGPSIQTITACKNSAQTYYIFPNLPGFSFTWTVVGGTPALSTGNPKVINWGNGTEGLIQVIITDASGNCRDTITRKVCLLNSPVASFTTAPSTTVCANSTPITFSSTSLGANSYIWDFGDGSGSNVQNPPPHVYTTPGTYTVLLTVSNGGGGTGGPAGESRCGCTDTATVVITVLAGTGPKIVPGCKQMFCPGDTSTYCVTTGCAPFNWTVNGGIIINNTGNCITVQWNATPPVNFPASVSVTTGCGGICGNAATLIVPVLWNNMPISGPDTVCVGATGTYALPAMPGTFYTWTVSGGGGTIVGPNLNTPTINVLWSGPAGNATITCSYNNPYTGCSGTSTKIIKVRNRFLATGPSPVCTGNTGYYSVTGGGLANWTIFPLTGYTVGGSMTNVPGISVNWTTAGNYTITATAANAGLYCNPNAIINVVVNPTPVLNNIIGPASICPGSYYTYSVSSNMTGPFVWTPSVNGTVISQMGANNDSVIVQWNLTGPYSLSVSQTVNGCTGTKLLSPINNVPPVTISGTSTVCRDQSPNPFYTATGGLPAGSYTWSVSPAAAGTIMGGQGTNQISVLWHGTVSPGASSAMVSVVICNYAAVNYPVTINTPPNLTITRSGSLCTMPGVTLTVSPALTCYQWYLNGVAISGATSPTYVATTYGYYEVKCPSQCSGYGGIFIPREYIPNVSITANNKRIYCIGEPISLTLFSAAGGACMFQWFKNNLPLGGPSAVNTPLNVTTVGNYYQVVSCGNCKDTSNSIKIDTVTCTPAPGCDFSFLPPQFNNNMDKAGPSENDPVIDAAPFTATLNIGPPTNFCNNPQFSAVYSLTSPHSLNSGIHWNFGDGGTFSTTTSGGFTPAHTYTAVGIYVVSAYIDVNCPPPPTPHICRLVDTIHYVVPIAANFGASVNCEKVYLNNLSSVISGCSITNYAWSASGPGSYSFSNPAAASPVLTVGASGTYNVTLTVTSSCSGCTATITLPVVVTLPSATFTAPSPVCAGTPIAFNAPGGMSNYLWNFGDGYTSSMQNTTHAFGLTPSNPTIVLTVSNSLGCKAKDSVTISVIAPPVLSISPVQKICPGATTTITATGAGFTTYAWYHNNVLVQSGPSNTYTTGAVGSYYVIANTASGACAVKSALTYIFHHPKPVAKIKGSSVACLNGGVANIYLYNSVNIPSSTYAWNLQGNPAILSNVFDLSITVNAVGNYSYVITVTDSTGCIARDTFCVVVGIAPVVTVSTSPGIKCAGVPHTFTASATPPNPNYLYQWNNGATGPVMSTSLPGMYLVTVTNPANGCFGNAFAGIIQPRPSTILFPVGCDTICDYDSIVPPLALGGPIIAGNYTVQWFLNGNYGSPIYTGPVLNLLGNMPPLVYGMNNISIVVTYNGCTDTSNAYNLFIKKCGDCDCTESHWGETTVTEGEKPPALNKTKANVPQGGNPITLKCNVAQKLDCNKTYTISSSYVCKDTSCPGKVTYSLQPPTGPAITGTGTLTFTTSQTGTYILTMYGWCGDKICDSCIIDIIVDCKKCDCKESKWDKITLTPGKTDKLPVDDPALGKTKNPPVVTDPKTISLNCNKTYKLDCNKPYTLSANYFCMDPACPPKVTYSLQPPTGLPITGTLPPAYTFTPTQNGVYVLTMYGWCGDKICDSCIIKFEVKCVDCDCKGSKWGEQTVTINENTKSFKCGQQQDVKCKVPVTVNANYVCADAKCNAAVTYSMQPPVGAAVTGTLPLTFIPNQSGTYTVTMYGWCGNTICDSCVIKFKTVCDEKDCCPYEIKAETGTVKYDHTQIPNATVAAQTFTINGLALANITEVRANVVSYTITDNYDKECMKCVNLPFTWASITSASNIGAIPGLITMFGGTTVPSFNGSGTGAYKNPREVVWNNGSQINIPNGTNIGINFILPPPPKIDCCELKGRICVKFTFRDNDCKECEVIACFDFVIKKK
ncbi:MAG: PKD domain-containing protein [Chitinophagaceae bacterium]|nr:PKD domain-containing protein [Chitinophagaceae bacterium]